MSGSRSSLKKASLVFNPRAENTWSKDDSKFGQRMLEKMGWKKGEGVGLNNQGIAENIKIRFKLDSKGLGYKIKEDKWVEVENGFSELLSHLSQRSDCEKNSKRPSLESTSHSLRSRVHYHKFTRGKDISKYNVKDLMGILGQTNTDDQKNENSKTNSNYSSDEATNEAGNQKIDAGTNNTKIKSKNDGDNIKKKRKKKNTKACEIVEIEDDKFEGAASNKDENLLQNDSISEHGQSDNGQRKDFIHMKKKTKEYEIIGVTNVILGGANSNKDEEIPLQNNHIREHRRSSDRQIDDKENNNIPDDRSNESFQNICKYQKNYNTDKNNQLEYGICDGYSGNINDNYKLTKRKKLKKVSGDETKFEVSQDHSSNEEHFKLPDTEKKYDFCNNESANDQSNSVELESNSRKYKLCKNKKKDEHSVNNESADEQFNNREQKIVETITQKIKSGKNDEDRTCENLIPLKRKKRKHGNCLTDVIDNRPSNLKEYDPTTLKEKRKKVKIESEKSNGTSTLKSCDTSVLQWKPKNSDILSRTIESFMESVKEYNETSNVEDIIKKFEDDEQRLLNKYRENYKMKYLSTANENDSRIYCELNGDELDVKKGIEDDKDLKKEIEDDKYVRSLNNLGRKLTRAERIILKARLLKKIQNKGVHHDFKGSNLAEITGYGNNTSKVS